MWYYSIDGQQLGPLDDAALDRSIAQGVITPETFVWKEGLTEWTPLRQVERRVPTLAPASPSAETCSICGKAVGADNLIELLGQRVCAACKPATVQQMREGVAPVGSNVAWQEKKRVVTHDKAVLPARCYKCNAPADTTPLRRKLYWHNPIFYLLIFLNLFVYVIVAMIVRKRAAVDVHLCGRHLRRRKNFIVGGWIAAGVSIAIIIGGMAENSAIFIVLGFIFFLSAIIGGLVGASTTRATRIKANTVWMSGAGPEFRASLPSWPG
jgi:hypothetical protein